MSDFQIHFLIFSRVLGFCEIAVFFGRLVIIRTCNNPIFAIYLYFWSLKRFEISKKNGFWLFGHFWSYLENFGIWRFFSNLLIHFASGSRSAPLSSIARLFGLFRWSTTGNTRIYSISSNLGDRSRLTDTNISRFWLISLYSPLTITLLPYRVQLCIALLSYRKIFFSVLKSQFLALKMLALR